MALTISGYLHRKVNKSTEYVPMSVCQLEIIKPMIAKGPNSKEKQFVRITAVAEQPLKTVKLTYNSVSDNGGIGDLHASCFVEYGDAESWSADWNRTAYLFQSRIDMLIQGAADDKYKRVSREQAYEAFSALVKYSQKYHGMKEVIINSKNFEATSLIEFRATENDGDFETSPYWIDNIAHLSGFVLNGSDAVDSARKVYVSHGWESLQILRPLSARTLYRNHVKMHDGAKQIMVGDVYVFEGEDMVALVKGVKFQGIPRAVLNMLLPPSNRAASHLSAHVIPSANSSASRSKVKDFQPEKAKDSIPIETSPQLKSQSHKASNPVVAKCMAIVSEELGLEPSELTDGAAFADLGLDSLMSLTVTGRMREELDLDAPTSLFVDNATIGDAKAAIITLVGNDLNDSSNEIEIIDTSEPENATADVEPARAPLMGSVIAQSSTEDVTEKLLCIVSEELGIEVSEILETGNFADMGVDSLMSLSITGRIREEHDLDIPTSFFVDHPDIEKARMAISTLTSTNPSGGITPYSYADDADSGDTNTTPSIPDLDDASPPISAKKIVEDEAPCVATSLLLSGNPKTASKILFLLPDGSGSAASYYKLPSISLEVCVYGLNCPFMKSPSGYTNGIDGVSKQYISEIKRRQPNGPYYLGGWSAGGVLAYEIANQLMAIGDKTERLFLIDSPCPINLEPLPSSLLHFIDSMGLLGTQGSPPAWLIPHFESSIANLASYRPRPMDPEEAPQTLIIWARHGLCRDPKDRNFPRSAKEAKSIKFLLDDRLDLGPKGWDELLSEENILTVPVKGNHFTMIREPYVSLLPTSICR